jgi:hypothetical protein
VLLIDIWHPDLSPEHIHRLLTRFPSSPSSQSESQFDSELNSFSAATITTAAHNMIEMGEGRFIVPPQSVRLEDGLLSVSVPRIDLRSTPQSAPPVTAAHLESKITFKIVLLGDTSVGKSCFLLRYFDDQFVIPSVTIGVDFVCNLSIICFYSLSEDTYSRLRQSTHSNPNGLFLVSSFDL